MKSLIFLIISNLVISTGCVGPQIKNSDLEQKRTQASVGSYKTSGLCNGLPKVISVSTAPGFCLGVLDQGVGLVKPRYALQIDAKRILVTDMGGWKENAGQVYLLTLTDHLWTRAPFLNSSSVTKDKNCILDRTQQLIKGPDNLIYITSAQCVATLDLTKENLGQSLEIKISHLPTNGLHNLKVITFNSEGDILMNVGSVTDNCENESSETCKELKPVPSKP